MLSYKEELLMFGLVELFKKSRFDICTVRELAKVAGNGSLPRDLETEFSLLHCVEYANIPGGLRHGLPLRVIQALASSTHPGVELDVEAIHKELVRRLMEGFERQAVPDSLPNHVVDHVEDVVRERSFSFRSFFKRS